MAAVIPQGVSVANVRTFEIQRVIFSTNTFPHATKSITISPREKADLTISELTVNASQSRKFPRKRKVMATIICLETDFAFIYQLYILMQQPIGAQILTADGDYFTFIKNGTTNTAQIQGSATGSNLGVLGWEFVIKDDARYVTLTFETEITLAEEFWMQNNMSGAVAGVAVPMKSAGTQANNVGGQASFGMPGWNSGAPAALTNSGGTGQVGVFVGGELSIKSANIGKYNDNMQFYDRLLVSGKLNFAGVSSSDLQSQLGTSMEKPISLVLDTYNADMIKLTGLSINNSYRIGDSDMGLTIMIDGHAVRNPNDAATAPLPNIDIGQNDPLTLQINLVNS